MKSFNDILLCIDIYITKICKRAQVIYATYMVIVYVRYQYGINLSEWLLQYLLTKIRSQSHPIAGTPIEVPVPRKINFISH